MELYLAFKLLLAMEMSLSVEPCIARDRKVSFVSQSQRNEVKNQKLELEKAKKLKVKVRKDNKISSKAGVRKTGKKYKLQLGKMQKKTENVRVRK